MALGQPSDNSGGDVFTTIILQEMAPRLKLLVRLSASTGHSLNEFMMEVAEDTVVGAPQGQERLFPPVKYFPSREVFAHPAMAGGD